MFCTATLVTLARMGTQNVLPDLCGAVSDRDGASILGAGKFARCMPHLVPEEHFVNAVTWGGAIFQLANVTGPALGGLLFTLPLARLVPGSGLEGAGIVYIFTLVTLAWFLVLILSLSVGPDGWSIAPHR